MSYKSRKYKTAKSKKDEGLPLLCVFIAGVFVIFTLPFATARFCFSYIHFWWKLFLLFNSGMNSVVYFFRRRLESYQAKISQKMELYIEVLDEPLEEIAIQFKLENKWISRTVIDNIVL